MNRRRVLLALSTLSLASPPAFAQSVNTLPGMTTVTFAPGSNTTTFAGQLVPGGRSVYYVQAKAGQTLMVSVMPIATGITFQVFKADASLAKGADGLPVVGRSAEIPGLVLATGHYRNGILLAPLTASLVADLILEGRDDPALALMAPNRAR